jgi:hypothetical protein
MTSTRQQPTNVKNVAVRYEPFRDVLTVQFGSEAEQVHAGVVIDDVFAAFDAERLGEPIVVRIATPFWGRDPAWLTAVERLVGERTLALGRELAEEETSEVRWISMDAAEASMHAQDRAAYHRTICQRAAVEPPTTSSLNSEERPRGRTHEMPRKAR